jgi:hypothetical protein
MNSILNHEQCFDCMRSFVSMLKDEWSKILGVKKLDPNSALILAGVWWIARKFRGEERRKY